MTDRQTAPLGTKRSRRRAGRSCRCSPDRSPPRALSLSPLSSVSSLWLWSPSVRSQLAAVRHGFVERRQRGIGLRVLFRRLPYQGQWFELVARVLWARVSVWGFCFSCSIWTREMDFVRFFCWCISRLQSRTRTTLVLMMRWWWCVSMASRRRGMFASKGLALGGGSLPVDLMWVLAKICSLLILWRNYKLFICTVHCSCSLFIVHVHCSPSSLVKGTVMYHTIVTEWSKWIVHTYKWTTPQWYKWSKWIKLCC